MTTLEIQAQIDDFQRYSDEQHRLLKTELMEGVAELKEMLQRFIRQQNQSSQDPYNSQNPNPYPLEPGPISSVTQPMETPHPPGQHLHLPPNTSEKHGDMILLKPLDIAFSSDPETELTDGSVKEVNTSVVGDSDRALVIYQPLDWDSTSSGTELALSGNIISSDFVDPFLLDVEKYAESGVVPSSYVLDCFRTPAVCENVRANVPVVFDRPPVVGFKNHLTADMKVNIKGFVFMKPPPHPPDIEVDPKDTFCLLKNHHLLIPLRSRELDASLESQKKLINQDGVTSICHWVEKPPSWPPDAVVANYEGLFTKFRKYVPGYLKIVDISNISKTIEFTLGKITGDMLCLLKICASSCVRLSVMGCFINSVTVCAQYDNSRKLMTGKPLDYLPLVFNMGRYLVAIHGFLQRRCFGDLTEVMINQCVTPLEVKTTYIVMRLPTFSVYDTMCYINGKTCHFISNESEADHICFGMRCVVDTEKINFDTKWIVIPQWRAKLAVIASFKLRSQTYYGSSEEFTIKIWIIQDNGSYDKIWSHIPVAGSSPIHGLASKVHTFQPNMMSLPYVNLRQQGVVLFVEGFATKYSESTCNFLERRFSSYTKAFLFCSIEPTYAIQDTTLQFRKASYDPGGLSFRDILINAIYLVELAKATTLSSVTICVFLVPICWASVFKSGLGNLRAAVAMRVSYYLTVTFLALYKQFWSICAVGWTPKFVNYDTTILHSVECVKMLKVSLVIKLGIFNVMFDSQTNLIIEALDHSNDQQGWLEYLGSFNVAAEVSVMVSRMCKLIGNIRCYGPVSQWSFSSPIPYQISTFTNMVCEPTLHILIIHICSSGQSSVVRPAPCTTILPVNSTLIRQMLLKDDSVKNGARKTMRRLMGNSDQAISSWIDMLSNCEEDKLDILISERHDLFSSYMENLSVTRFDGTHKKATRVCDEALCN